MLLGIRPATRTLLSAAQLYYTIGWGKDLLDVYSKLVDEKQRAFVIEKLEANSKYVVSLRANNRMGDRRPVYETMRTREEWTPEPLSPLISPVGSKAIIFIDDCRSLLVGYHLASQPGKNIT